MNREIKAEDVNYVIVQDNGKAIVWESNNMPVIYGGIEDAEMDLKEELGEKIITLGEYAKSLGIDWRLLVDDNIFCPLEKLRIFLSDKEDKCFIFEEHSIKDIEYANTYITSVYDDGKTIQYGYECNGFLFTADVSYYMAEELMIEIMKHIYPR